MPFSADGNPIIGQLADKGGSPLCGLWCVSGLGGAGFMRGGMAGYLLAQVISGAAHSRNDAVFNVEHLSRERELSILSSKVLKPADPTRFWTAK